MQSSQDQKRSRRSVNRRTRRLLFVSIYLLFVLSLCEIGCRVYWKITAAVPFLRPRDALFTFYPELRDSGLGEKTVRNDDDCFDVLLLGGSVFHRDYGDIPSKLQQSLNAELKRPIRVYNVSNIGRTSFDSLERYRLLREHRFDLVIVYDGINDARMNHCPREVFRDDYSHCDWYDRWARFKRHPEFAYLTLPYTLEHAVIDIKLRAGWGDYIPRLRPRKKWIMESADIKTEHTFRANMNQIVSLAHERQEPILLMTFANYLPADYSELSFQNHELDFADHTTPVRIWGEPQAVARALRLHNQILTDIAAQDRSILFLDQNAGIAKSKTNFNDICHLTSTGCSQWVENAVLALRPAISERNLAELSR